MITGRNSALRWFVSLIPDADPHLTGWRSISAGELLLSRWKQDEPFDTKAHWFTYLRTNLGGGFAALEFVRRMAEKDGLVRDDVRFTPNGQQRYFGLLSSK